MSKKKPWSKLQTALYKVIDPKANFQIHQAVYKLNSNNPRSSQPYQLPRYWITIDKDIIFDFPKMFETRYRYWPEEVSSISNLLRDYIDTPKEELLVKDFKDAWGVTDILKLVDKRLGQRSFEKIMQEQKLLRMIDEKVFSKEIIQKIKTNRWS